MARLRPLQTHGLGAALSTFHGGDAGLSPSRGRPSSAGSSPTTSGSLLPCAELLTAAGYGAGSDPAVATLLRVCNSALRNPEGVLSPRIYFLSSCSLKPLAGRLTPQRSTETDLVEVSSAPGC